MGREWAIISALGPTPVPVAPALGFCPGAEVTGAHFYVMGQVEGKALYNTADSEDWVAADQRETLGWSFIDVLVDLHSLDPDEIGLGDLGKKENYIGRQLKPGIGRGRPLRRRQTTMIPSCTNCRLT